MAGNLGKFFRLFCVWSMSISSPKKITRPIASHLDRKAWSIKDLLYGLREKVLPEHSG